VKFSKKIKQLDASFTWSKAQGRTAGYDFSSVNILDFHPDEFARQFTLIDHRLFIQLPLTGTMMMLMRSDDLLLLLLFR
jgi:hypothetical protein